MPSLETQINLYRTASKVATNANSAYRLRDQVAHLRKMTNLNRPRNVVQDLAIDAAKQLEIAEVALAAAFDDLSNYAELLDAAGFDVDAAAGCDELPRASDELKAEYVAACDRRDAGN